MTESAEESSSPTTYTTAQVAAHFKVKVGTVRSWVTDGCPAERRGKGKPIQFDIRKVAEWKSGSASVGANLDPQKEKALLDRARRIKVETEVKVLRGRLVPTEQVEEL